MIGKPEWFLIYYHEAYHIVRPGAVTISLGHHSAREVHLCWCDQEGRVICMDKEPNWVVHLSAVEEWVTR